MLNRNLFYLAKPFIPRSLQLLIRRQLARFQRRRHAQTWPIHQAGFAVPEGWPGWPGGKRFCLVLSHDVDTQKGHDDAIKLLELEERLGFRSSFNFVAEKYRVSIDLIREIQRRGFGVCVHGLKHDGLLFLNKGIFAARARRINKYLAYWGTRGFTAPSMIRNLEWMHALDIDYATSTFDTDPFEPQPDGVGTVFPFWVANGVREKGYVELPYTLPQDSTLFIILRESSIAIWKRKLDWIASRGGMALLNTHPDYMDFGTKAMGRETYPAEFYTEFLHYIRETHAGDYHHALPQEVSHYVHQAHPWKSKPGAPGQTSVDQVPIHASADSTRP